MWTEPAVTINGIQLSESQAMTVRIAVTNFLHELNNPELLGSDTHGRQMTRAYKARANEVMHIIGRHTNASPGV